MKIAKLICNRCDELILKMPVDKLDKYESLGKYLSLKHKEQRHRPVCESCKSPLVVLRVDDFGEPIDCHTTWEQYLCDVCHDKIWQELLDNACGICETEPCKRGKDCWVNPFPRIMYLCYIAPRVKAEDVIFARSPDSD